MAKEEQKEIIIKLQIPAGKATPAPPVGPALGGSGVNIMDFVKQFNDRTAEQAGLFQLLLQFTKINLSILLLKNHLWLY